MNAINTKGEWISYQDTFGEVGYFLEYTQQALIRLLSGDITLWEFWEITNEKYQCVVWESRKIDSAYEQGDMWRLAIMEWGPNYVELFLPQKERCMEILSELGVN